MDGELTIRPAQPSDRASMERICAHTWEWGDYVPEVWDDWLTGAEGVVIVGEVEGRAVALSKITFQTADQVWLEGMRVDPDFRRRGIARQFLAHSLAYAQGRGARVVRLGTGHHNTPVHTIAARAGMEQVGSYVLLSAEPLPEGPQPRFLGMKHAEQVQSFLAGSPVLAHTYGLYSAHWAWQELSAARVTYFLTRGRVSASLEPDGQIGALVIVEHDPEDDEVWISFACGQPPALLELATAVRAHAAKLGAEKVCVMLPDLNWLRDVFYAAGYGLGDWEGELWIFERQLLSTGEGHDG
jgi:GNAT superfamily N-acetyltransferase